MTVFNRTDICFLIEKRALRICDEARLGIPDPVGAAALAQEIVGLILHSSEPLREPLDPPQTTKDSTE